MRLTERVKLAALEAGFDRVAVTTLEPLAAAEAAIQERIRTSLMDGLHWFTPDRARLATQPAALLEGARSILALAASYLGRCDSVPSEPGCPRGRIARYAWGQDYHDVLRQMALALVGRLPEIAGRPVRTRIFVDSSPLAERAVAERAGLGWFGKNTMTLIPGIGSWTFLAEIILDLELEPDAPLRKTCGACTRCLDVCPTGALVAPYVLDNRRCISFLTIEHKGAIDLALRPLMGRWVFGCDDCQDVCPVNRKALPARSGDFRARNPEYAYPRLLPLLEISDMEFRARFRGSAVLRAKHWGMQRNAAVALGNAQDPVAAPALTRVVRDLDRHPVVRGHAAWALGRYREPAAARALEAAARVDPDESVRVEANLALASLKAAA